MHLLEHVLVVVGQAAIVHLAVDETVVGAVGLAQKVAVALGEHHQAVGQAVILEGCQHVVQLRHSGGDLLADFLEDVGADPHALIGVVVILVHADQRGNLTLVVDHVLIDVGIGVDQGPVGGHILLHQGEQVDEDLVLDGLDAAAGVVIGALLDHVRQIAGGAAEHEVVGVILGGHGNDVQLNAGDLFHLRKHRRVLGLGDLVEEGRPRLPVGQGGGLVHQGIFNLKRRLDSLGLSGLFRSGCFRLRRRGGFFHGAFHGLCRFPCGLGRFFRGALRSRRHSLRGRCCSIAAAGKQHHHHRQSQQQCKQTLFHGFILLVISFAHPNYTVCMICIQLSKINLHYQNP